MSEEIMQDASIRPAPHTTAITNTNKVSDVQTAPAVSTYKRRVPTVPIELPSGLSIRARNTGPWFWVPKNGIRKIHNCKTLTVSQKRVAKLVYATLGWIASDEQSDVFEVGIGWIAQQSSFGYRTVLDIIPVLEQLALVYVKRHIETRGENQQPHTFALLHVPSDFVRQSKRKESRAGSAKNGTRQTPTSENISPKGRYNKENDTGNAAELVRLPEGANSSGVTGQSGTAQTPCAASVKRQPITRGGF